MAEYEASRKQHKRVLLIVDDTESNRNLLRAVLEGAGFETITAEDGELALAILQKNNVDGIVSDILMPNMDGFRLCNELKNSPRTKHIPILLQTSAYLSTEDEQFAATIGADAFLRRPYDLDALIKAVTSMVEIPAAEPLELDPAKVKGRHVERIVAALARTQSELVQITNEAKAGSNRFQQLLEHLPAAYIYSDAKSVIMEWNPAAQKIFGYRAKEAIGKTLDELLFSRASTEMDSATESLIEHKRENGEKVFCEWSHTVLTTPEGQIQGMISVAKDVTERIIAEAKSQSFVLQLRELSARIVDAQEQERRHIANELHDEIGQMLLGLRLSMEMSKRTGTIAAEAESITAELIHRVRELSLDLRPPMLDDLGLLPALAWFCERSGRVGIPIELKHRNIEGLDANVRTRTAAFRIVQEAVTNAAKHARASSVHVNVWAAQDYLHVQIQDNGVGFDVPQAWQRKDSSGLVGMLERANAASGTFCVESAPGEGTIVMATLPHCQLRKPRCRPS